MFRVRCLLTVVTLAIAAPSATRFAWAESRILVTGAAGFVGPHLVARLLKAGNTVTALDHLHTNNWPAQYHQMKGLRLIKADLRDLSAVLTAAGDCSTIFHLGANASVLKSATDPKGSWIQSNLNGTLNVAIAAAQTGVERVVFASSSMVYAPVKGKQLLQETHRVDPANPYGRSKWLGENVLRAYAKGGQYTLSIARQFNIFGPGQESAVVPMLIEQLKKSPASLTLTAPRSCSRDFTHVSDAVSALLLLSQTKADTAPPHGVFNVCNGQHVRLGELAQGIAQAMGLQNTHIGYGDPRPGDIGALAGDSSRLRGLGWSPKVPLDHGLRQIVGATQPSDATFDANPPQATR